MVFDRTSKALEQRTHLNGAQARGTVRLAIKEAGLDADTVRADQMRVVIEKVLPGEIAAHGVDDVEGVCEALKQVLEDVDGTGVEDSADRVDGFFRRTL